MHSTQHCQRWREQRDSYRPSGEPINTSIYGVEPIKESAAKDFVIRHHYSRSYPAARARFGLFRITPFRQPELVGCAIYSVPMNNHSIPKYCGTDPIKGVELGRFVLLDNVEANGETWFLGQAFKQLNTLLPDVHAVLSYSDPIPRYTVEGEILTPGHVGTIYQAHNGRHVGRSRARTLMMGPDGRVISERTLSKLRNEESGAQGAYQQVLNLGGSPMRHGESGDAYIRRQVAEGLFSRIKHPGNLAYVWALGGKREKRLLQRRFPAPLPYPKKEAFCG